jgi:hypothetical protein
MKEGESYKRIGIPFFFFWTLQSMYHIETNALKRIK